jgi:hypothetical protein
MKVAPPREVRVRWWGVFLLGYIWCHLTQVSTHDSLHNWRTVNVEYLKDIGLKGRQIIGLHGALTSLGPALTSDIVEKVKLRSLLK